MAARTKQNLIPFRKSRRNSLVPLLRRSRAPESSQGYELKSMPLLIHCTQKLLAEIPGRFIDSSASGASWHANLLRFDRRKCVLFTHDETLYSVFVPGLRKPEFEQLDEVFGQRLFKALVWDEFPQTQIERMLEACPRDPLHALQQPQRAGLDERHPVSDRSACRTRRRSGQR